MAKINVILLEDVAGQGRKGEIISVSDGYAHNFLIKNKKAVMATKDELNKMEAQKKKIEKLEEENKNEALEIKRLLESKPVHVGMKIGDNGKIFGAVTTKEVQNAIKSTFGIDVDKKKIDCNIKTTGVHDIIVKIHSEVKATVKLYIDQL